MCLLTDQGDDDTERDDDRALGRRHSRGSMTGQGVRRQTRGTVTEQGDDDRAGDGDRVGGR